MGERRSIDRILALAKERGWNQTELAGLLEVLPQHVTNWKKRGIPPEYLPKIADLFKTTVDELIGRQSSSRSWSFGSSRGMWEEQPISDRQRENEEAVLQAIRRNMDAANQPMISQKKTGEANARKSKKARKHHSRR